jgi:flagellar biosynthesis protein FlhF
MRAGLSAKQAQTLGTATIPQLRRALTESLAAALTFAPIEAVPPKPLVIVGPAGAGKSACVAKLAARTLASQHDVLVVSADSERCGGAEQLRAMAARLGARFEAVSTLADLSDLILQARDLGLVVIVDAPAASPTQPADMRAIGRLIEHTRLEPIVCLPADMHPEELDELARAYRQLGAKRAIATRLDLTTRRACVMHVLQNAGLALAQVSATPYIPGGVAIATATRLTNLLLEPFEDALQEDAA